VLGERRLAEADEAAELVDRMFALGKMTEHGETPFVAHRPQ
jgi:hypothetical protein